MTVRPNASAAMSKHRPADNLANGQAVATPAPAAARPRGPHVVNPDAVYTLASAAAALGLAKECLPREVRLGRLEARKRAGRYWLLGRWLIRWLETGQPHRSWRPAE
jgi:hypothetical protein